jgi:PBP1b-binding outer membrane lipoprotein LpoB
MKKYLSIISCFLLLVLLVGCSSDSTSDPREVVISMFGAMEKNDKAALAGILDLPELMKIYNSDYALKTDSIRMFTSPQQILEDLTDDGLTKTRWFSYQRIINKSFVDGEVATVEITFVDKENSVGYRTKFGLHKINTKWRIYSFKTIEEAP